MKLLIVSDSHRQLEMMYLSVLREQPDAVLHLGDHTYDARRLSQEFPDIPVLMVRGNCDFSDQEPPESLERVFDGVRIFAVHGHRYGVKQGLLRLELAARQSGAQVALFGHTHCPYCEEHMGLWLLNPGACSGRNPTYGIVVLQNDTAQCCVKKLDSEEKL